MEWIDTKDRLPEIPEGKHGLTVLAVEFDPCFEELSPGEGSTVRQKMYTKKYGWTDLLLGMKNNDTSFTQCCFQITHWTPLPEPPEAK